MVLQWMAMVLQKQSFANSLLLHWDQERSQQSFETAGWNDGEGEVAQCRRRNWEKAQGNPSCCLHQPGGWLQGRQSKAIFGCAQAKVQEAMDTSCNKVIDIRKKSSQWGWSDPATDFQTSVGISIFENFQNLTGQCPEQLCLPVTSWVAAWPG